MTVADRWSKRSIVVAQQLRRDRIPFPVERPRSDRPVRLPIPIGRIASVTLDAMQIGMHPRGIAAIRVHDDLVCLVPVALLRPPQRSERRRDVARRGPGRQAALEFRKGHELSLYSDARAAASVAGAREALARARDPVELRPPTSTAARSGRPPARSPRRAR